jgi:molybdenum cofactor cytidylyltransferase
MVARVVDALLATPARPIVVVTGHDASHVRQALGARSIQLVHNPDFADGLSTSLRAGLKALGPAVEGALVCLGDMPWVSPAALERLLAEFNPAEGRAICVPCYGGKRGNPVLWSSRYFPEMERLVGDVGARELLDLHAEAVALVALDEPGVTLDVDTREMLEALDGPGPGKAGGSDA